MSTPARTHPFSIPTSRGNTVHGDVRWVEDGGVKPAVVFCHGFKGFKDWGPFPAWGRALANHGFVSVHFNFSHNGVTPEHPTEFVDLEAFAQNTYTLELNDLQAVMGYVATAAQGDAPIDVERIGLMGHSRGGGTAILQTSRDDRVRALATWSSVSTFLGRFSRSQIQDWTETGTTTIENQRTGQTMRLDRVLYDDAVENADALDVLEAASTIDVPWLVVHATDDEAVDIAAAQRLTEASSSAELIEVRGGHTFGGAHLFEEPVPESLQEVWDATLHHFDTHLYREP